MRCYVVDAFTDRAFSGNPAAVVLLDEPADERWMQSVAAEMNLSETAFVEHRAEGPLPLRWFTPAVEVDLCGHATLAVGHVLGGERVFRTRSGELRTTSSGGVLSMDFPADVPGPAADEVRAVRAGLPGVTVRGVSRGAADLVVEVGSAAELRALQPDLSAVAGWPARCVIVTAPGDRAGIDFVSRVFAPAVGIPEDPVTGAAHCALAPYWAQRLGRAELVGEQVSARGGVVGVRLDGERVTLEGRAVTVLSGELHV